MVDSGRFAYPVTGFKVTLILRNGGYFFAMFHVKHPNNSQGSQGWDSQQVATTATTSYTYVKNARQRFGGAELGAQYREFQNRGGKDRYLLEWAGGEMGNS